MKSNRFALAAALAMTASAYPLSSPHNGFDLPTMPAIRNTGPRHGPKAKFRGNAQARRLARKRRNIRARSPMARKG